MLDHDLIFSAFVLVCILGGLLAGMSIRVRLPEHHLDKPSEDAVRIAMGTLATLTALVIGLLVAASRTTFDTRTSEINEFSGDLILLDRQLVHYGPEAADARDLLRRYAVYKIESTWPDEGAQAPDPEGWKLLEEVQDRVRGFTPKDDAHQWLRSRALDVSGSLARTRWLLDVQRASAVPWPFLAILVLWLTVLFVSFGVFAPRNGTVLAAMSVCAVSLAASVFLILEMDRPFSGTIRIPSAAMREAASRIGAPAALQ